MNKKIAFIDHSYHKKTKSSNFFVALLKEQYKVDIYFDTYWEDKKVFDFESLNNKDYDAIIFWQTNYSIKYLKPIKCKNIIFIPMYDDLKANTITPFYWKQFGSVKFISFSRTLHDYLSKNNLESFYIQYFLKPKEINPTVDYKNLTAFFWYRMENINWETIKNLISTETFKKIYIQNHPDPLQEKLQISKEDIEKYNIMIVDWFESKDEYLELLKSVDVYFAPREYEGIGLSFLEAMSYGKVVVALDKPTMNEYIVHGKNGFLFDSKTDEKIDFSTINPQNILQINEKYYEDYINNGEQVFQWIEKTTNRKIIQKDKFYFFADKLLWLPFKIWRKLFK